MAASTQLFLTDRNIDRKVSFVIITPSFALRSQKHARCNKSVDILQQLVATSGYQDAFAWLATAY